MFYANRFFLSFFFDHTDILHRKYLCNGNYIISRKTADGMVFINSKIKYFFTNVTKKLKNCFFIEIVNYIWCT